MIIFNDSGAKYLYGEHDVEEINQRFEETKYSENFKAIFETEEFKRFYRRMIEDYQDFLESQRQLLSFERKYLSKAENIWNCYYAMTVTRWWHMSYDKWLDGELDMRKNLLNLQNMQFCKAVLIDMLNGCKKNINLLYHSKKLSLYC